MTTLRVLLSAAPSPARADAWAMFDGDGRCVRRGRNVPAEWPAADAREAVLAAELVRIVALTLPPLNGARKPNTTAAVLRFTTFAFSRAAVFCLELFAYVLITLPTNNSAKCQRR